MSYQGTKEELKELLSWIEKDRLEQESRELEAQIATCGMQDNQEELLRLVTRKNVVNNHLQDLRQKNSLWQP